MKSFILLLAAFLTAAAASAQNNSSPFRKGYTRLGIQLPGNAVDNTLSLKANMIKGNWGNDLGFVFEKGLIFYFIGKEKARLFNVGLDWTVVSFGFTSTAKSWKTYAANTTGYVAGDIGAKMLLSAASKLGPVFSINPVKDLVIDVRAQASLGAYGIGPVYEAYDKTEAGYDIVADGIKNAFYPYPHNEDATGIKQVTQAFHTLIKPNIGATVRWRGIGLSADYSPGNLKMKYKAVDNGVESTGESTVAMNTFQVKLSLQGKQ